MFWTDEKRERRLRELQERCEKLERDMHALKLDWENTYDKVRQMMGRIAKRAEMLHDEAEKNGRLYPSEPSADAPNSPAEALTPRQRALQHQILTRRQRM